MLGLPISRDDMVPGSPEEQSLMAADRRCRSRRAPRSARRWALIDQTARSCSSARARTGIVFVFPTSTGQAEFPTRDQDASRVFRYDPAPRTTAGTTASTTRSAGDNPLNGNMYKPIYFDDGQAIHGANNVPTEPGQPRLRPAARRPTRTLLIGWLGLADDGGQIWDADRIDFTVRVPGPLLTGGRAVSIDRVTVAGAIVAMVVLVAACGTPGQGLPAAQDDSIVQLDLVDPARPTAATASTPGSPSRPLPTTVYLPPGGGRAPLIVLAHGAGGAPEKFTELASYWAATATSSPCPASR